MVDVGALVFLVDWVSSEERCCVPWFRELVDMRVQREEGTSRAYDIELIMMDFQDGCSAFVLWLLALFVVR